MCEWVREKEREREKESEWVSEREKLTQQECFYISNSSHSRCLAILSRPQVAYHCVLQMATSVRHNPNVTIHTVIIECKFVYYFLLEWLIIRVSHITKSTPWPHKITGHKGTKLDFSHKIMQWNAISTFLGKLAIKPFDMYSLIYKLKRLYPSTLEPQTETGLQLYFHLETRWMQTGHRVAIYEVLMIQWGCQR